MLSPEVGGGRRAGEEQETCPQEEVSRMFIATVFITARNWKHPKCSSRGEQLKILWHLHGMKHHSAIKMNQLLIQPTAE